MQIPESYTETGYIQVQASTARQALPIPDATITISMIYDGEPVLFKTAKTDSSGKTDIIAVPAPPKILSESPGTQHPYSEYIVQIDADGYQPVGNVRTTVFPDVISLIPISMIPSGVGQPAEPQIINPEPPAL